MIVKNNNLITVIIATYNRCESLKDTLTSLLNQEKQAGLDYEVIVADNNSKDSTKEAVEGLKMRFNGRLRYLFEPRQGKSFALNRAIETAKGRIIAFTDDDCIVDKNWLQQIDNTFKEAKIGIAGGLINPIWLSPRPAWLNKKFYGKLGLQDYGRKPFVTTSEERLPFGANFSFKRDLFAKFGSFNEEMRLALDTEICLRFLRKGIKIGYNPQMVVYHKIKPDNLQKAYLRRWFFYRGLLHRYIQDYQRRFYHPCGVPLWMVLCYILDIIRSLNLFLPAGTRIYYRCHSFWWLGMITAKFKERVARGVNDKTGFKMPPKIRI